MADLVAEGLALGLLLSLGAFFLHHHVRRRGDELSCMDLLGGLDRRPGSQLRPGAGP